MFINNPFSAASDHTWTGSNIFNQNVIFNGSYVYTGSSTHISGLGGVGSGGADVVFESGQGVVGNENSGDVIIRSNTYAGSGQHGDIIFQFGTVDSGKRMYLEGSSTGKIVMRDLTDAIGAELLTINKGQAGSGVSNGAVVVNGYLNGSSGNLILNNLYSEGAQSGGALVNVSNCIITKSTDQVGSILIANSGTLDKSDGGSATCYFCSPGPSTGGNWDAHYVSVNEDLILTAVSFNDNAGYGIEIIGGSASAGNNDGGSVQIEPGKGYGTGDNGVVQIGAEDEDIDIALGNCSDDQDGQDVLLEGSEGGADDAGAGGHSGYTLYISGGPGTDAKTGSGMSGGNGADLCLGGGSAGAGDGIGPNGNIGLCILGENIDGDRSVVVQNCPASAPADGNLTSGQLTVWVDEAGNALTFKVKYSDGSTIKSGTVALT